MKRRIRNWIFDLLYPDMRSWFEQEYYLLLYREDLSTTTDDERIGLKVRRHVVNVMWKRLYGEER